MSPPGSTGGTAVQTAVAHYHRLAMQPVLGTMPVASHATGATASVSALSFRMDIGHPERGEHWYTPGQFTSQTVSARLDVPRHPDPVQYGTDAGLVVVFVGVSGVTWYRRRSG